MAVDAQTTITEIRLKRALGDPANEIRRDIIELGARAISKHHGDNPDALQIVGVKDLRHKPTYGDPMWKKYLGDAEAVIYALFPEWKDDLETRGRNPATGVLGQ